MANPSEPNPTDISGIRVLWITKRRYMNKDLVDDRYGRYFDLPKLLSDRGCHIELVAVSYDKRPPQAQTHSDHFTLNSIGIHPLPRFRRFLKECVDRFQPDVIVGASDIPYVFFTRWLARYSGKPSVFDIYDNFETYASSRIPFMVNAYYRALKDIDHVVVFEQLLGAHIGQKTGRNDFSVIPNTADEQVFRAHDAAASRQVLGLDPDPIYLAYVGAIATNRGFDTILDAWKTVHQARADVKLLLAGARDASISTEIPGARYFGLLPHAEVPRLISAADLCLISYKADDFGRFSFPVKAFEYLSCERPVLAPRIGGIIALYEDQPEYLYEPENAEDLAARILQLIERPRHSLPPIMRQSEAVDAYAGVIGMMARG